jgi:hypothetical protein
MYFGWCRPDTPPPPKKIVPVFKVAANLIWGVERMLVVVWEPVLEKLETFLRVNISF